MATVKTTKETLFETEVHRFAGKFALMSPEPDAAKAESYFDRALTVPCQQQAKSWELRAAMSMARRRHGFGCWSQPAYGFPGILPSAIVHAAPEFICG